jgi:hypothetical protein
VVVLFLAGFLVDMTARRPSILLTLGLDNAALLAAMPRG